MVADQGPAATMPHRAFVEEALTHFERDPRLLGVAAGGSWLSGTMDEFSDLDLVVVVRAELYATVMQERQAMAERLGPLIAAFTGEHVGEHRLLICLYGPPLLHVDLKFIAPEDLRHRVEDPVVLWERDGSLTRGLGEGQAVWPKPRLQWIEDRFWVWIHYAAAKLGRGELFEVMDMLAFLRSQVLAPLAAVAAQKTPRGVRYVERDLPHILEPLRRTLAAHERASCAEAVDAAIEMYLTLRQRLADAELVYRAEAERVSREYLRSVSARPPIAGP